MDYAGSFIEKIANKNAVMAVIGMGYVGFPLAVEIALKGFHAWGVDSYSARIAALTEGKNHIPDVDDQDFLEVLRAERFQPTMDYSVLREADAVIICVPTPLDRHQQPDISFIESAARSIAPHIKTGSLIILESTTYPGTTEGLLRTELERGGKKAGQDFYLAFSPERVDPGNAQFKTRNTPKVVGGMGEDANRMCQALYKAVLDTEIHAVSSPAVAEMEKILENTFRNINIGLANEMALVCDRMGIDVWEVIDAAKTKPYGFMPFYPGPGVGGHCIPLDPYYLSWKAKEFGYSMRLIETSGNINAAMPEYVIGRVYRNMGRRGVAMKGAKVLVLGVAYKAGIGDYRESPALELMRLLEAEGASVSYYDPYVPELDPAKDAHLPFKGRYLSGMITSRVLSEADLVLIATAHRNVDYSFVLQNAKAVFDTRNATRGMVSDNLEKL